MFDKIESEYTNMKTITYIRHGESQANRDNVFGDRDSPLTDTGYQQAREAAHKLLIIPDIIISSPQPRAHETALTIAKEIGYDGEIVINSDLIERKYGILTGTEFIHNSDVLDTSNDPTAESLDDLYARAKRFHDYVISLKQDNILVVAHGSFGRSLVRVFKSIKLHEPVEFLKNAEPFILYNEA